MKIITIVGARPQFVKAAVVSRALAKIDGVEELIFHTGQHYDQNMSDIFFQEMKIPKPKFKHNLTKRSHGGMTGEMIEEIEKVLLSEKPDALVVYGDTNSTLAGALAAAKLHIPIAHVEAGLRSFNNRMPEEQNRILVDKLSTWLFCPTISAMNNLKEDKPMQKNATIELVGDVMCDATLFYQKMSQKVDIDKEYYLATVHRASNTDSQENLTQIFKALGQIAEEKKVILPLHPRTKSKIEEFGIDTSRLTLIEPVGYLEMISLIENSSGVLTDSGGLQKEAYLLKKPCVTLREQTEWVELIENGSNILVGSSLDKILDEGRKFLEEGFKSENPFLYGGGDAGEKIARRLVEGVK